VTDPAPDARHAARVLALDEAFAALPAPCRRLVYRWREAVCLSGRASACGSELAALERFVRDVGRLAGELAGVDTPAPEGKAAGAVTTGSGV
jgi:hypothetical protein